MMAYEDMNGVKRLMAQAAPDLAKKIKAIPGDDDREMTTALLRSFEKAAEASDLKAENDNLKTENAALLAEVAAMKSTNEALDDELRVEKSTAAMGLDVNFRAAFDRDLVDPTSPMTTNSTPRGEDYGDLLGNIEDEDEFDSTE